jgi:hypothetical protein
MACSATKRPYFGIVCASLRRLQDLLTSSSHVNNKKRLSWRGKAEVDRKEAKTKDSEGSGAEAQDDRQIAWLNCRQ